MISPDPVDPEKAKRADALVEKALADFRTDREREWQEIWDEAKWPERVPPMPKPEDVPIGWTASDRKRAEERLEEYQRQFNAATKKTTREIIKLGRKRHRPGTDDELDYDFIFDRDAAAEVYLKIGPPFFESPRAGGWLASLSWTARAKPKEPKPKAPKPKAVEILRPLVSDGQTYIQNASDNSNEMREAAGARRALELLFHAVLESTKPTRAAERDTPGKKGYVNWDEIRDAVPKWRKLGRGEKADFVKDFVAKALERHVSLKAATVERALREAMKVMDSPTNIGRQKPE